MELDDNTKRTLCYVINVNQITDKQPNVGLVKQELLESHDVLLKQEVHANKSKTLPKKEKLQFPGSNTLEEEIIRNWPLELKSETPDQDCDVKCDANAFIKQELLHEELDIKSEDETIQETCLDDKYKLGNKLSNPITISMVVKPFKCGSCDYSSERKCNLQRHLNTHTGEKPFQCQICDTRFTQKGHLKTHLRNHTRRKPFKCNICDYRCSQNSTLKIHLRIHTGEKPFKCNVCDYCCVRSGDLKSHLISHTGKKHFKCHICDYSCAQKSNLKIHLRTHTGEKPFKCKICDYCCAHISSLKRHLKTHTEM